MHEISIALSLLCIVFFIAKLQLRLYHQEPPKFWHAQVNETFHVPLFVEPHFTFGSRGQAIQITHIYDG